MRTFCVTGNAVAPLATIAGLLASAGMEPALPSRQDNSLTIQSWHQRVCQSAGSIPGPITTPGKFWEQLAGDIFLSNYTKTYWGWALVESVRLLDFWHDYDPGLAFLLVYTDPVAATAGAMQGRDVLPTIVDTWLDSTRQMLRFYNRHPERCLLIDGQEGTSHSSALLEVCASRWGLSSDARIGNTAAPPPAAAPLALHLAAELLKNYPQTSELHHEIMATLTRLAPANAPPASMLLPPLEVVVTSYQTLCAEGARLSVLEQQVEETRGTLKTVQTELSTTQNTLDISQQSLNEVQQENDLLLLQLHQVQEELEHYFLLHQELQKQNSQHEQRWQQMLARNPDYCNAGSISVEAGPEAQAHWTISDLDAVGRSIGKLNLNTTFENGICGFSIVRPSTDAPAPLVRWPAPAFNQTELLIIPTGTRTTIIPRLETVLSLGSSDWRLIRALNDLLITSLHDHSLNLPAELQRPLLLEGLEKCRQQLDKIPPVVRYDRLVLQREQVNPDYEHLWFALDGVSFGKPCWTTFEFRLSCANVRPGQFGTHPKLEFPEQIGQAPLSGWFHESSDDFGPKYELRFDLINAAMDTVVWQRLTAEDQAFVRSLVNGLPAMLASLEHSGTQLTRAWGDWKTVALGIDRQLAANALPLHSNADENQDPDSRHMPVQATTKQRVKKKA